MAALPGANIFILEANPLMGGSLDGAGDPQHGYSLRGGRMLMNENYDKYSEMLVSGKAVLIIGEVNNDEDKAKLFPQEIIPLDDAPKKFTRQVHLRLSTANLTAENLQAARSICEASAGRVPVFLCLKRPGGEMIFIESHEKYFVTPTRQLQQSVDDHFGEETYYARGITRCPNEPGARGNASRTMAAMMVIDAEIAQMSDIVIENYAG